MRSDSQTVPGWTLIELLFVLALMGLCAGLAAPSYHGLQQRSQRAQARMLLLQTAQSLERTAGVQGSYPTTLPAIAGSTSRRVSTASKVGSLSSCRSRL